MLLSYVTVLCVLCGSTAGFIHDEMCIGNTYKLPSSYTPPAFTGKLYLANWEYGYRKLLMDKGQSKDRRLKVSNGSAEVTDLKQNVIFSTAFQQSVIKLTIKDCTTRKQVSYGRIFTFSVPREAEYLEFVPPDARGRQMVLWNRTNPQITIGDRGQMRNGGWKINSVTYADAGLYNFRAKDSALLPSIALEVEAHTLYYEVNANERIVFNYPSDETSWDVTYQSPEDAYQEPLLYKGKYRWIQPFTTRLHVTDGGFVIDPVKSTDGGTYKFKDQHNQLAQTVYLTVIPEPDNVYVSVGIGVGVVLVVIICCCCVRKCCCKKSSSKSAASPPETAAAPAVYYHGTAQPAGPSYSAAPTRDYSHTQYTRNSPASGRSTTISVEPAVNNPVNVHVNPPQPEVAPPGEGFNLSLGSNWLSSDAEPTFQLKGISSAAPLSSDTTFSSVYTSDKLNFK